MPKRVPKWLITASIGIGATGSMCASAAGAIEPAGADACKLLNAAQVSGVLGVQVDKGTYSIPGYTQLCVWREHGKPQMSAQNVRVSFLTTRQYELQKTGPSAKGSESGLGDEAYWGHTPELGSSLSVKKGSTYFRVQSRPIPERATRKSDTAADKTKRAEKERTVERAIAKEVLKKL